MALAFGVLIVVLVVVGSLLIMADLNDNMMPSAELHESANAALRRVAGAQKYKPSTVIARPCKRVANSGVMRTFHVEMMRG